MSTDKKSTKRAKEDLKKITNIQYNIDILREQIEEIDTILKGGAIQYGDKVQSSSNGKEDLHIKLIDMKRELTAMVSKKIDEMMVFNKRIDKINNNIYEAVLRQRYIKDYPWKIIASNIKKSESRTLTLHKYALIEYERLIEQELDNNKQQ